MNIKDLIRIKEAAQILRLKENTVYHLVHDRKIPFVKVRGRLFFQKEVIEKWQNDQIQIVEPEKSNSQ
jgi:excisionase family DNA binding protein